MTNQTGLLEILQPFWDELYPTHSQDDLATFSQEIQARKAQQTKTPLPEQWYRDTVVYSLYVDLFNNDFKGLKEKLPYLEELGVSCLWLLPILDSPMKDAGFDIRHYDRIRPELLGLSEDSSREEQMEIFGDFLQEAHQRGIRVIFDIALNHSSIEHEWFQSSKDDPSSPFRDYYIWSKTDEKYKDARIIFKGMCHSNWEKWGDEYYFHRFFEIQPDLNYQNPQVLMEVSKILLFWIDQGVDGFRLDAIPYIWKEEGTISENLPKAHTIIKYFRALIDYYRPGALMLAEACQPPLETVKYFGDGDECHACYHFPLMPRIYKSLADENREPIIQTLAPEFTPSIPESCQWFIFLRCHDELTLEMVTPEERKSIYEHYCQDPSWDFREGEGISARLANLFRHNSQQIQLAYSIILTMAATPILFYGDELAKSNDLDFDKAMREQTGYADSRYLVRGKIDWEWAESQLADEQSLTAQVFHGLKKQLAVRKHHTCFGRGELSWVEVQSGGQINPHILAYTRSGEEEILLIIHNLSASSQTFSLPDALKQSTSKDLLGKPLQWDASNDALTMARHEFHWIRLS